MILDDVWELVFGKVLKLLDKSFETVGVRGIQNLKSYVSISAGFFDPLGQANQVQRGLISVMKR